MVTAELASNNQAVLCTSFKNIYSVGSTVIAVVTVYVSEMGRTGLVMPAKYRPTVCK